MPSRPALTPYAPDQATLIPHHSLYIMYTLIISIACSVAVSILLKVARRQRIDIAQAIAVNYVVAASLCLLVLRPDPATILNPTSPWWVLIALGILLPSVFLAMAGAVRHAGI